MTALKVTVDTPLDAFVEEQVRLGAYPNADAVVRAGLALLAEDDAARTARYHSLLQDGVDDLDNGRYETVEDVTAWLKDLGPKPSA